MNTTFVYYAHQSILIIYTIVIHSLGALYVHCHSMSMRSNVITETNAVELHAVTTLMKF